MRALVWTRKINFAICKLNGLRSPILGMGWIGHDLQFQLQIGMEVVSDPKSE
jgi:hypothetical protein